MTRALQARHHVVDVDGCLVRTSAPGGAGGQPFPGAAALLDALRDRGTLVVCTNASQQTPAHYAAHLRSIGLGVADEELVTAGSAAAAHIAHAYPGARVHAVGDVGLIEPLQDHGMALVAADGEPADVVVCGAAGAYTAADLDLACRSVDAGAPLLATHDTPWFHGGRGRSLAVTAAIAHAVAWVTDARVEVVGKPSPALAAALLRRLGGDPEVIAVVGDAPAEIALARHMGAHSVLVLTGQVAPDGVGALEQAPDVVVADVAELGRRLLPVPTAARGAPR